MKINKKLIIIFVVVMVVLITLGVLRHTKQYKILKADVLYGDTVCDCKSGDMRLAGQAFTAWRCQICRKKSTHPNTVTPKICEKCSKASRKMF